MPTYTEPVQIGNVLIEFEINKLKHGVKPELKNFFSTYGLDPNRGSFSDIEIPTGTIETIALRFGLAGMKRAGHSIELNPFNPVDSFPEIDDIEVEKEIDLYEEALKALVKHNSWLGKNAPYALVFNQYLPKEDKENPQNPTSAEGTSGKPLTSGSELLSQSSD